MEGTIPLIVAGVKAEQIGELGVFNGAAHGTSDVVVAVEGAASGAIREKIHGVPLGVTPEKCAAGTGDGNADSIDGVDGHIDAVQGTSGPFNFGRVGMGICAGRRQSKTTVAGHERESAGNPYEAFSTGDEGDVIGDGEEGIGSVADASVEGIVHRSASGCGLIAIGSRAGSTQVSITGRSKSGAAAGGCVEGARRMRLEAIHGLQQGLGVAGEILEDVELVVEEVESDVFVGLAIAEEFKDLGFCVDLIFEGGVQGVEENYADGGTGAIGSFAVGKDV